MVANISVAVLHVALCSLCNSIRPFECAVDITCNTVDRQPDILALFEQRADNQLTEHELASQILQAAVTRTDSFRSNERACRKKWTGRERLIVNWYRNFTDRVFICANLINSEDLLGGYVYNLLRLIDVIGHRRVFVAVYENGSTDHTKDILRTLDILLSVLGIDHAIDRDNQPAIGPKTHRIEHLAYVRNRAMRQFYANASFDRVVFINDVFFCDYDILELLMQSVRRNADITCGLDLDTPSGLGFYDTWVYRGLDGRMLTQKYLAPPDMPADRRPYRAMCCWNGAAVLSAAPFVQDRIRFRRSEPEECSASECSLLCKDFLLHGYDRILVVPSVMFVYNSADLEPLTGLYHKLPYIHRYTDSAITFDQLADPRDVECAGLVGSGIRSPDRPVIREQVRIGTSIH